MPADSGSRTTSPSKADGRGLPARLPASAPLAAVAPALAVGVASRGSSRWPAALRSRIAKFLDAHRRQFF
jgi:hypothetical protein